MFKLFCKKEQKIYKKRTKHLIFKNEEFDVGVTTLVVEFTDGRVFNMKLYGKNNQYFQLGNDETKFRPYYEPITGVVNISSSRKVAETFLSQIQDQIPFTLVDDPEYPTKSEVGLIRKAIILDTQPYIKTISVAVVEPISVLEK